MKFRKGMYITHPEKGVGICVAMFALKRDAEGKAVMHQEVDRDSDGNSELADNGTVKMIDTDRPVFEEAGAGFFTTPADLRVSFHRIDSKGETEAVTLEPLDGIRQAKYKEIPKARRDTSAPKDVMALMGYD